MLFFVPAISLILASLLMMNAYAQTGSTASIETMESAYGVGIVQGAAQRESSFHYYPPEINVPTGTTVVWFNNDFGQPHTVTSGPVNASDAGSVFNSGVIPSNSLFQQTFNSAGEYIYHCAIHPWMQASVSVSNAFQRGNNFEMSSGTGHTLNLTQDERTLLTFRPLTIQLDSATPLVYNVTIIENNEDSVFSETFVTKWIPIIIRIGVR